MIGFFDRDVFLKLGCCNLWDQALVVLEVTQPFRLASTTSVPSNRKIISRMVPGADLAPIEKRVSAMIENVPVVSDELVEEMSKTDWMSRLDGVDDIDAGEQLLLALLLSSADDRVLISGDKRFITASINHLPDEVAKLSVALISFERCLSLIEQSYGFEFVHEQAYGVRTCDGSLRLAFGKTPNVETFQQALASLDPMKGL